MHFGSMRNTQSLACPMNPFNQQTIPHGCIETYYGSPNPQVDIEVALYSIRASPPQGGEAKQTEIAPTQIPSYRNSQQSCFKIQLYHTLEN